LVNPNLRIPDSLGRGGLTACEGERSAQRALVDCLMPAVNALLDLARTRHMLGTARWNAVTEFAGPNDSGSKMPGSNGHKKPRIEGGVMIGN